MAISVKDIQEKEFTAVSDNGYSMEQVDDFLDELAEEWGAMIRENLALSEQVKQLQGDLAQAQSASAEMEKKLPDYNEKAYFQNLETAIRESLIGAQRIADETVSEAKRQAQQTLDDANAAAEQTKSGAQAAAEKTVADAGAQAQGIAASAQQTVDRLNAEADRLRGTIEGYKAQLKSLIDAQLATLSGNKD